MEQETTAQEQSTQTPPKSGPGMMPLIVVAIVVLAAVGGIFAYNEFLRPAPALVTATISVDFGNGTVLSREISSDNNTALGLLRTYVGPENVDATSAGFINSIHGVGNGADVPGLDDTDQRWWMLYVDGALGEVGADKLQIFDGDAVEFKFMVPEW